MILIGVDYKGEFLYSIHHHDYAESEDGKAAIDGGQFDYTRRIGEACELPLKALSVQYTYAALRNAEKVGNKLKFSTKDVKLLDYPLEDAYLEQRRQESRFIWEARNLDKQTREFKMLDELNSSHLKRILDLDYLSKDYRNEINLILKDRE